MFTSTLAGIAVFGLLFAIGMLGLITSSAAAERFSPTRRADTADDLRAGPGRSATFLR